jgi:hypothetical protein
MSEQLIEILKAENARLKKENEALVSESARIIGKQLSAEDRSALAFVDKARGEYVRSDEVAAALGISGSAQISSFADLKRTAPRLKAMVTGFAYFKKAARLFMEQKPKVGAAKSRITLLFIVHGFCCLSLSASPSFPGCG